MVTSPAKTAAATVKRRKKLGVDMGKLVAELQRQPKFEHRLRKTSKLHPRDFPARALMTGAVHELEHTDDPLIAVEIAMDHLEERTDYYRRLHRAIPNAGANKSDIKIPKEWADELYAWGEFSPASQSLGESAAKGEHVDPVRARLAVEELRELAKTMKDKRLARMAHVLRGRLENRIFEHELGIAEENPTAKKTETICTPCGPMVCPAGKKGGRCKPLEGTTMKRAATNDGNLTGLHTIEPTRGRWQQLRMGGETYATYYGSGLFGIAVKKGESWSGYLIQGEREQKRVSKVVKANNAHALQGKLEDMAEHKLERVEGASKRRSR